MFDFAVVSLGNFGEFGIAARAGGVGTEGAEFGGGDVGACIHLEGFVRADDIRFELFPSIVVGCHKLRCGSRR